MKTPRRPPLGSSIGDGLKVDQGDAGPGRLVVENSDLRANADASITTGGIASVRPIDMLVARDV